MVRLQRMGSTLHRPATALRVAFVASAALSGIAVMTVDGCGGTEGTRAGPGAGNDAAAAPEADPCVASQAFEFMPLARFEDTDTQMTIGGRGGTQLAGQYSTFVSFDQTGQIFTDDGKAAMTSGCTTGWQPMLTIDKGAAPPEARCGSDTQALHLRANGGAPGVELSNWGMNIGIDLRQNCSCGSTSYPAPACPQRDHPEKGCATNCSPAGAYCFFDASTWTGISFWALLGEQSTGQTALVTVSDPNTVGQAGISNNEPMGANGPLTGAALAAFVEQTYPFNAPTCGNPPCVTFGDGGLFDAGMDCVANRMPLCLCDPYGKGVGLVKRWEFYAIPFDELRQKGYGVPESALDIAHILGFKMSLGKGAWDVWLDDVAFYRPKKS